MKTIPAAVYILSGIALALWIASIACAVAALRWARTQSKRAVGYACATLVICAVAVLGVTVRFGQDQVRTRSVFGTGETTTTTAGWHINSRWFFAVSAILGVVALVVAVRHLTKRSAPDEQRHPPLDTNAPGRH